MRVPVPEDGGPDDPVADADYASAFRVRTGGGARGWTPTDWTRAVFEGGPAPVRMFVQLGWRFVLRLRLGGSGADRVAGWRVTSADATSATLSAESPLLDARNTAIVGDDDVTWVTRVRLRRPPGRLVWTVAAQVHHVVVPYLLRRAARKAAE